MTEIEYKKIIKKFQNEKDPDLITNDILCNLINLIKDILLFDLLDNETVIKFLVVYKNKIKLSNKKILNIYNRLNKVNVNGKTEENDYPLLCSVMNNNILVMKLFMKYAN